MHILGVSDGQVIRLTSHHKTRGSFSQAPSDIQHQSIFVNEFVVVSIWTEIVRITIYAAPLQRLLSSARILRLSHRLICVSICNESKLKFLTTYLLTVSAYRASCRCSTVAMLKFLPWYHRNECQTITAPLKAPPHPAYSLAQCSATHMLQARDKEKRISAVWGSACDLGSKGVYTN